MSASIEQRAVKYLLRTFRSPTYRFEGTGMNDCELYLVEKKTNRRFKVELKSTAAKQIRRSDIFSNLVFSHTNEVKLFRGKKSKIVRIFMGDKPPKIFLLGAGILNAGAEFKREDRYVLRGAKSYEDIKSLKSIKR
jgi:hypothetical protein